VENEITGRWQRPLMAGERKGNAAFALADLLSLRGLERPCETLVA
jgi:hypothetical protein